METMDVSKRVNSVQSFLKPRPKGVTLYDVWKENLCIIVIFAQAKT